MTIKRISIFNEFKCTGAACSASCCRGWKVPVDYDMYMKYLTEKGLFGTLLRCSIEKKEDFTAFRSTPRGCPFWGLDRLCAIQKKHGAEYMPAVCIQFPRQLNNLEFFCEETLYLACPEAARLFLVSVVQNRPFDFSVSEGEPGYKSNTTNDDRDFLDYLLESRDELAAMLRGGTHFDSMAIINYGRGAQNACLGKTPLPRPAKYLSDERYIVGCEKMSILFEDGFYHPNLRTVSPFLHKLCKKYIRRLGSLCRTSPAAADKRLDSLKQGLCQKMPGLDTLLNRYFEYYLYTDFLDIFEDYSFLRHILFGIAKAHMLTCFLALYAEEKDSISTDEIAKIIAVYERRAPQIKGAVARIVSL